MSRTLAEGGRLSASLRRAILPIAVTLLVAACGDASEPASVPAATEREPTTSTRVSSRPAATSPSSTVPRSTSTAGPPVAVPAGVPEGDDREVAQTVDGDTIEVDGGERVRLIGIDTPETKHPSRGVECYGREASARTSEILPRGTAVRLAYDVERLDRYDRTLAYVYRISDGMFVNLTLVEEGFAQAYTYPPNAAHTDEFVAAGRTAREEGRGLWGDACAETTTSVPGQAGACDASYPDVCIPSPPPDLDCGDVEHRRFRVEGADPHRFDSDDDGVGCESG